MRRTFIVLAILYLFIFDFDSKAQIVINEILASNTTTNLDGINKNFSDWIELYNNSEKEVTIGNWYLTDNKLKPTKWIIPFYISIPPKGYKLFWADKLNTSNHTNFNLNVNGEAIYLYNKDTILIDSMVYPIQDQDISFGRARGAKNQLVYFQEVTPMKENSLFYSKELELSSIPLFSHKAGFYENPLNIKLYTSSNDEEIYYTLDGSEPTRQSIQYTKSIEVSKNTVIRARTYSADKLPSKIHTQSYFIDESFSLPVISLTSNPKYFWDKNIGIYANGVNYKENSWESANYFQPWERPVHIEYFNSKSEIGFKINAGVRIHGRSSRNNAQKSLAIYTRSKYGSSVVPYKLYGDTSPDSIRTFLLRNGGNEWGMTMLLDGLVHTLVIDKIDIDAQLYQPSIVFLNGNYWGIHNIREKINKYYIRDKYQNDTADFDILETDGIAGKIIASNGSLDQYNSLVKFIEKNDLSITENYDSVKKLIDINEFVNYLITQVYITNRDWPNSNMKFWKERGKEGKWRWILYDTELSFKKTNEYFQFNMFEHMLAENSKQYPTMSWANFLIRKLLDNEEFKSEFIQRMAVYLHTVFDTDRVMCVLDSLKQNIEPEIKRNNMKWGGMRQKTAPYLITSATMEEWDANIKFVHTYIKARPSEIRENMMNYFHLKDTVNLKLEINDLNAGKISLMGYVLEESGFNGYIFTDIPVRLEAIPNEGYEFVKWKGGDNDSKCEISLNKNKKLIAIFKKVEDI